MAVSIIIPAYNEEKIIFSTLDSLKELINQKNTEIIVVCNGCTDNTSRVVKDFSEKILCIETDIGSKTYALNLGDEIASFFPRIYLDADINLSISAIYAMVEYLKDFDLLSTSVAPKMEFAKNSWWIKCYYDIWLDLPYCKAGMIGSGVYALSEKGRQKFEKFPPIMGDDAFIRALFNEQERKLTPNAYATVKAPKDFFSLIKIKTRSRLGRYELRDKYPYLLKNEEKDYVQVIKNFVLDYKNWHKILIYITTNLISRIRASYQYYYHKKLGKEMNLLEVKHKRVLLISSSGGHWKQLQRLEKVFNNFEKHYACTNSDYFLSTSLPFHNIPEASQWDRKKLIWQAISVFFLLLKLRPQIVITTGASIGFFALFFAKKMGCKTIWIDSLANAEQISLSGLKAKPYADLWVTQWEHLAQPNGPYFYGTVL